MGWCYFDVGSLIKKRLDLIKTYFTKVNKI